MRLSFKLLGSLTLALCLTGSALSIGCASEPAAADDGSASSDISGPLSDARTCAIEKAYLAAEVDDFTMLTREQLPFAAGVVSGDYYSTYASLAVPGVGTVYYIEQPYFGDGGSAAIAGTFYDATGHVLMTSFSDNGAPTRFFTLIGGRELSCGGSPGTKDAGPAPHPVGEGGAPHPIYDAATGG